MSIHRIDRLRPDAHICLLAASSGLLVARQDVAFRDMATDSVGLPATVCPQPDATDRRVFPGTGILKKFSLNLTI